MKIKPTSIDGVLIIEPRIFKDERGEFFESFNQLIFDKATSGKYQFVQDNQSISKKNVLRGLHFQKPPFAQGKLVRVISGAVLDVAVDIRTDSNTYGQHVAVELSKDNNRQLFIPPGFAHGFIALEENTVFSYKCTNSYSKDAERIILWNDRSLNIKWDTNHPIISEKDQLGRSFNEFKGLF